MPYKSIWKNVFPKLKSSNMSLICIYKKEVSLLYQVITPVLAVQREFTDLSLAVYVRLACPHIQITENFWLLKAANQN